MSRLSVWKSHPQRKADSYGMSMSNGITNLGYKRPFGAYQRYFTIGTTSEGPRYLGGLRLIC